MERIKKIALWLDQNKTKVHEFVRYCIVGVIATAIHYSVYYVLQKHINVNIAYTIGYLTSFICNYFMTSHFTFRSSPSVKNALGFGTGHLLNYTLHIVLLNFYLYLGVSKLIAPFFVLAIVVPTNFIVLRFFFKHKSKEQYVK
jgi:putative flippase GtrA